MSPDIACGNYMGEGRTCCLRYKHEGEHEAGERVLVDRHFRPLDRADVRRKNGERGMAHVHDYKGKLTISIDSERCRGVSMQEVRRPAVRCGDRWLVRVPTLEVIDRSKRIAAA